MSSGNSLLDLKLTQVAVKMKNLILLDLSFPEAHFPEFRKAYENRFIHLPCRSQMALPMAAGLASLAKVVVIFGHEYEDCVLPDPSLNVKILRERPEGTWDTLEQGLQAFGPAILWIPELDSHS